MGQNAMNTEYILDYSYQTCFDDGGIQHDSGWCRSEVSLWECSTDEEAIVKAKEILKTSFPCNGSWCDNRGERKFHGLYYVETVVNKREIKIK